MKIAKFVEIKISKSIAELQSKRDHRTLVLWTTDCAEHVLPYFEEKYPQDAIDGN
ncbi:MAG: putative immunity protein [Paenibacillaceae bacterium]